MGTNITPEVSKKSKYWISRHRYYELKHFCLQYPAWKIEANALSQKITSVATDVVNSGGGIMQEMRATEELAIKRGRYIGMMTTIEEALNCVDHSLQPFIFQAVTENLSYTYLKEKRRIPCCKDVYYEEYRKFFWYLDQIRD